MLEHHQAAIDAALSGNFIPLNMIEQKMAENAGLSPHRAGQDENDAIREFSGFHIVGQILTPTGRAEGYHWATHCKACIGKGVLYAEGSGGKYHPLDCPECGGDGFNESDLETDCNGIVIER